MRLIDVDAITEDEKEIYGFFHDFDLDDLLDGQPTIDAVSVVRCKDCKHWHDHITTTWCSRGAELRPQESGWIKRSADDFCSYGVKKGAETEG